MPAILLAVAAGLCWAVGELCTKMVLSSGQIGPITAVTVRCAVALPIMLLVYLLAVPVLKTEPTGWMSAKSDILVKLIVGSGVIAGAAALVFFYWGLKVGELSTVKPVAFTVAPAVAVLLAWGFLGEVPTTKKLVGVALVLVGVAIIASSRKEPLTSPSPANQTGNDVERP